MYSKLIPQGFPRRTPKGSQDHQKTIKNGNLLEPFLSSERTPTGTLTWGSLGRVLGGSWGALLGAPGWADPGRLRMHPGEAPEVVLGPGGNLRRGELSLRTSERRTPGRPETKWLRTETPWKTKTLVANSPRPSTAWWPHKGAGGFSFINIFLKYL